MAPPEINQQQLVDSLPERIRVQNRCDKLDLSMCHLVKVPLRTIEENYEGNPKHLDLSYNFIRFISPRFTLNMISLSKLDLRKNNIEKLPDNFGSLRKLVYLDLHGNKLRTLPLSMSKMKRLQFLCISDNPLRSSLRDFLGQTDSSVTAVAMAELVVNFLEEFTTAHTPEIDRSRSVSRSSRSSRVHYKSRSRNMGGDGDTSASSITSEVVDTVKDPPRSSSPYVLGGRIAIWLAVTVIVLGSFTEPSFLGVDPFWDLFKSISENINWATSWIPKNPTFVFREPQPEHVFFESMPLHEKIGYTISAWFN